MAKPIRVLACGDVDGRFNQLFARVRSIQKKAGSFDMLLCVGSFFGPENSEWESFKSGESKVPVSTYVLGANELAHSSMYPDEDGCELCPNVTYLGKRGRFTGASGLSIAYLSGVDRATTTESTSPEVHFTPTDIQALTVPITAESSFSGVDILLTSQWPRGADKYGSKAEGVDCSKAGSEFISQIALALRPRYHFCGMEDAFYERQPYRNHKVLQEPTKHVTRFISLAKVGNLKKKKFIYAFNITPMKAMDTVELTKQPDGVTECPYKANPGLMQDPKQAQADKPAQFFYDQKALDRKPGQGKKRPQDRQGGGLPKKPPQPTGPCWFCLGSPEVEKHLVVSVGTECYVALPKGGLTDDHVLILPIGHYQSTVSAPDDVLAEIDKYKTCLRKMYKSQGKSAVFYERNYKSQHLQIQVVPVPEDVSAEVKETFQGCALCQDIELHEIPAMSDLKQIVPEGAPYFYAELPSNDKLLHRIKKGFSLQFGREALAHDTLLNLPQKVDWRNCKLSKPEETALAKEFRSNFQKYDFTLL